MTNLETTWYHSFPTQEGYYLIKNDNTLLGLMEVKDVSPTRKDYIWLVWSETYACPSGFLASRIQFIVDGQNRGYAAISDWPANWSWKPVSNEE